MARRNALAAGTLLGALVLVALHLWRGIEYWNYSEGVYAYTSRLFLHGGDLYGHIVVAQPPWQFLFGAGALAIHDSLTFLRLAVGLAQLGAGVLAAIAVWRLTENPWATADRARADAADAVGAARARRADAGAARAAGAARRRAARRARRAPRATPARWPRSRRSSSGRTRSRLIAIVLFWAAPKKAFARRRDRHRGAGRRLHRDLRLRALGRQRDRADVLRPARP